MSKKELKKYLIVSAIYLILALALFLPLVKNPFTTVVGHEADVYQNMWDLWWVKYALFNAHVNIISTTKLLYWPVGVNLVFQTLSPISGLVSIPFQQLGIPFAYNAIFFLGFVISGIGAYVLAEYITKNTYASFFGGLAFSFSSFHISQAFGHMAFFNIGFTPLFLYLTIRTIEEKTVSLSLATSISIFLVFFMDGIEEGLMAIIALFIIILFYLAYKETRKRIMDRKSIYLACIAAIIFMLLSLFWIIPAINAALNGSISNANSLNSVQDNMGWSINAVMFFVPSFYNGLFHNLLYSYYNSIYDSPIQDRIGYIGYVVILLSVYGVLKDPKRSGLWLALLVIFGWLSLGPYLQIGNLVLNVPQLYFVIKALPVFNLIREPGRFDLVTSLAFAMISSIGLNAFFERSKSTSKPKMVGILFIVSLIFILESAGLPVVTLSSQTATPYIPQVLKEISGVPGNFSVISIPALGQQSQYYAAIATYYVTATRKPLVGGYITRLTSQDSLVLESIPFVVAASNLENTGQFFYNSPINENYTLESLKTMSDYRSYFIIMQGKAYNNTELPVMENYLERSFGKPVYSDSNITLFYAYNAIERTDFYSNNYISYYDQNDWLQVNTTNSSYAWALVNGTGTIFTYAPYRTGKENATNQSSINTTISFNVTSAKSSILYIEIHQYAQHANSNYTVRLNPGTGNYGIKTALLSGPNGNLVSFHYKYSGSSKNQVFIDGIRFNATG